VISVALSVIFRNSYVKYEAILVSLLVAVIHKPI